MIKDKNAILVLGMHRSGTSALTGTINMLGANIGDNIMGSTQYNKKGHYENMDIFKLNEYILHKLDTSWDNPMEFIIESGNHESFIKLIKDEIKNIFHDYPVIAIKDPRICLLIPLYNAALIQSGYEVNYVRTFRNPSDIISSMIDRDGFIFCKCQQIIDKYNSCIDRFLPENTFTISFSDLIDNTDHVIDLLCHYFPFLNYSDDNKKNVKEFLDPNLKHY